jgi:hypothetical protein
MNANIFGSISVIAQMMNRKGQRFQEQIDIANTSMKNMKLPEQLQNSIREFMMLTQSSLDSKKELEKFMCIISPSQRMAVTQHIFKIAVDSNSIFKGNAEMIDFVIDDVETLLYVPEDTIVTQG